jgi:hypothetical protein
MTTTPASTKHNKVFPPINGQITSDGSHRTAVPRCPMCTYPRRGVRTSDSAHRDVRFDASRRKGYRKMPHSKPLYRGLIPQRSLERRSAEHRRSHV